MNITKNILINKFLWLLLGLALSVGILYVTPELLIWRKLASLDKPFVLIQLTHHGDEAYGTISRFREIYEGHFPPGDLYLDDANAPTPFGPFQIMPALMAGFIALFGGNINVSYLAATFILSSIIFLLFYWLGKVITKNRLYSVFFALLGVMTPMFRALPAAFESASLFLNNIGNNFIPIVRTPLAKLPLGRTEDPLLTYLAFLPAIAALLIFWQKPSKKTGALAGALIGLVYYVYFHYWVFLTIVVGLIGLFAIFQMKKNFKFFKSTLFLFLALALVTIPYWVNFLSFQSSPTAEEVTRRIGVETSRRLGFIGGDPPIFHYIFYVFLAVFVYFVFYKRDQKNAAKLYWISIIAMFMVWNIQVITGFVPSPDHWFRPIGAFVFIILLHSLHELLKKINYKVIAILLIIGSALLVAKKAVNALVFINPPKQFIEENNFESRAFNPGVVESWDWINKNLPYEPKIISTSFITSLYLNAQTSARPYFVGGFNTAATNKLLEERFLTTYKLFKVKPEFLRRVLEIDYSKDMRSPEKYQDSPYPDGHTYLNMAEVIPHLYVGYYYGDPNRFPRSKTTYRFVSKEKADELIAAYPKLSVNWKDVEADYVYYGPWEKQITKIDLSQNPNLELIFSSGGGSAMGGKNKEVEIYKIIK